MSPVVSWAPGVGSTGGHMYDAGLSQKVLCCCLSSVSPLESLTSVRTYVRFVCECGSQSPPGGSMGESPESAACRLLNRRCQLRSCTDPVSGSNERPARGPAVAFGGVKKARIDAVLAEQGPVSLAHRGGRRGAGRRSPGRHRRPGRAAAEPAGRARGGAAGRLRAALRLARRDQAGERAGGARDRRRRPRLPRRRRLDRRLHRLPAAARRRPGRRGRRRLRPDRPAAARGSAGDRDRAPQRPRDDARPTCPSRPRWRRSTSPSSP